MTTEELHQYPDPDDALDMIYRLPAAEGSGYWRFLELREGLKFRTGNFRLRDRFVETSPEEEDDWLEYHFHFSGTHQDGRG